MTDFEAVQKYFQEYKLEVGQGLLIELDENLEIIQAVAFADSELMWRKALRLDNADKNFVRIDRIDTNVDDFWFIGNSFTKTVDCKSSRTVFFGNRREPKVKLQDVLNDLNQLASGIPSGDEE